MQRKWLSRRHCELRKEIMKTNILVHFVEIYDLVIFKEITLFFDIIILLDRKIFASP